MQIDWQMVAAIATCVLAVGVVSAIVQVRQARRSTNAQVALGLFDKLREKELKNTLRKIYQLKPASVKNLPTSTDKKDKELKNEIEDMLDKFEMLGALVERGIIDERLAIEAYGGPPVLKCWYKLHEYISEERKKRGLFCKYVEDFAARTWEYQRRKRPKDEWIKFRREEKDKPINLVEEFERNLALRPKRYKN